MRGATEKPFACPHGSRRCKCGFTCCLMNRLYLDALSMRLRRLFTPVIERANRSPIFILWRRVARRRHGAVCRRCASAGTGAVSPYHSRRSRAAALSLSRNLYRRPHALAGIFAVSSPSPAGGGAVRLRCICQRNLPAEILRAVNTLALIGALYGSIQGAQADRSSAVCWLTPASLSIRRSGGISPPPAVSPRRSLSLSPRWLCSPPDCCSRGSVCAGATEI